MSPGLIDRTGLPVGRLLAEGGEGRVHEVVGRPGTLYKEYRRPVEAAHLTDLVAWPTGAGVGPERAGTVQRSTAWPTAVVLSGRSGAVASEASGLLMPRAPERFSLRHRDGSSHLATLSYLTADPRRRGAAYGVALPEPVTAGRVGLALALARLVEAFEEATPAVGHGDLSARNVLWSLTAGPEVFVLDCDNAELYGANGTEEGDGRRRAMTPNWDDPAVVGGSNPGRWTDRYSLALIFLRIVGGAHFPLQKRQRTGEVVTVDFEVPHGVRRAAALGPAAPLWSLCSAALATGDPGSRPAAGDWVDTLTTVVEALGGPASPACASAADAGPRPASGRERAPGDVVVRPVSAEIRSRTFVVTRPTPTPTAQPGRPARTGATPGAPSVPTGPPRPAVPVTVQVRAAVRTAAAWWLLVHRRTARTLRSSGRRVQGIRRLAACVALDFLMACIGLFLIAMISGPFLGI